MKILYEKALPAHFKRWTEPAIKKRDYGNPLEMPEVQRAMSESETEKLLKTLRHGQDTLSLKNGLFLHSLSLTR